MRLKLRASLIQVAEGPKRGEPGDASLLGTWRECSLFSEALGQLLPSVGLQRFSHLIPSPAIPPSRFSSDCLGFTDSSLCFNLLLLPRARLLSDSMVENTVWASPRKDPLDWVTHASNFTASNPSFCFSVCLKGPGGELASLAWLGCRACGSQVLPRNRLLL